MPTDPLSLSLAELARSYRGGDLTALEVTERYLERLEPGPVYRLVTAERARAQAKRADELFAKGVDIGPLQGIPLALKDLMNTRGEVTAAGSRVLSEKGAASEDCPAASRLDAAGGVFLGKTNMTELAFSGLGLNPHFGTPGNALDASRIPGGSSSGSGVAVASQLACAAIGSDTGGSVRIPASFNGIVGLKTTDGVIPMDGCVPLSPTLDTLGSITRTVEDAWHLWQALSASAHAPLPRIEPEGRKLFAPLTVLHHELDPEVEAGFEAACERFTRMGVMVERGEAPELQEALNAYERFGTIVGMESLALYEEMLAAEGDRVDPRVSARILASDRRAVDYIRLGLERKRLQQRFWESVSGFDAVIAPTVAVLPPRIDGFAADDTYFRLNSLVLRNTMMFNFLACPAVSVPAGPSDGGLSVGVSIAGRPHDEPLILGIAQAFELAGTD